jgi:dihydroflavonol-4-reductase
MKILVTGATGLVGHGIATRLHAQGHEVVALVRSQARAAALLPGITLVEGDVTDRASVARAVEGAARVFHAAGMPEQWQRDPTTFDRVNCGGTVNVLEEALAAGVARVIYTSTMDVFAAEPGGTLVETRVDPEPKPTAYERSKQAADREVVRIGAAGLEVVHVCPAAVYGPGPSHVGLNSFFIKLLRKQTPILPPGGLPVLYVDGCAEAHLAAAERGRPGERYLVGDVRVSNRELAQAIAAVTGLPRVPPVAPRWLVSSMATVMEAFGRWFGWTPLIARGQLQFLQWFVDVDTTKAERELGFRPTPLEEGVTKTVAFLRAEGLVPAGPGVDPGEPA